MCNNIEKLYKEKSAYHRLKKKGLRIYISTVLLIWLLLTIKCYWLVINVIIITIICIKIEAEKILEQKLTIRFVFKKNKNETLDTIVDIKDKLLFKKFLVAQKINNQKVLDYLIDYYGKQVRDKNVKYDYLSILSIILTIVSPYTQGYNSSETANIMLKIIFISFMCYYPAKEFINYIKAAYGKDEMNKRLERIFNDLYFDLITESKAGNKKRYMPKNGILVNFIITSGDYNSKGLDDIPIKYKISEVFDGNIKMNELIKYLANKYIQPTEANLKNTYYYCTNFPKVLWEEYFDTKTAIFSDGLIIENNAYETELWKLDKQFNLSNKTIELVVCGPGIGGGVGDYNGIHFFFHPKEKDLHNRPHIHCSYSGEEFRVDLKSLKLMKKDKEFKNKKKTKKALDLIKLNQKELINYWNKVVVNGEYLKFEMLYEPEYIPTND